MSVLIKHMAMPKGCIYANDKDQTEYCPLLNHDDVPFCQYIETEPESAIGIDERPVYCPLFDVSESCQDTVSRAAAIDALDEIESEVADGYGYQYEKWRKYFCRLPSAQPTLDGYNIEHLVLIAKLLEKENLSPERVLEALTDIGRVVAIVLEEFEETLRKAVEQCKI